MDISEKDLRRIQSKISAPDDNGCMIWQDAVDKGGYAVCRLGNKQKRVHRLLYEVLVADIPADLVADHKCRVRNCVNVEHIEPVTVKENTHRGVGVAWQLNAAKTHCKRGHEFNEANTRYVQGRHGTQRQCRACDRDRAARKRGKDV